MPQPLIAFITQTGVRTPEFDKAKKREIRSHVMREWRLKRRLQTVNGGIVHTHSVNPANRTVQEQELSKSASQSKRSKKSFSQPQTSCTARKRSPNPGKTTPVKNNNPDSNDANVYETYQMIEDRLRQSMSLGSSRLNGLAMQYNYPIPQDQVKKMLVLMESCESDEISQRQVQKWVTNQSNSSSVLYLQSHPVLSVARLLA
jgi:phage pi2 protein 07